MLGRRRSQNRYLRNLETSKNFDRQPQVYVIGELPELIKGNLLAKRNWFHKFQRHGGFCLTVSITLIVPLEIISSYIDYLPEFGNWDFPLHLIGRQSTKLRNHAVHLPEL